MKINKKVMVTTLALAMGAALAGSISGSVAWYQYSTRTSAILAGTSAGTSRNLEVKNGVDGTYDQHIDLGSKNFRPASYAVVSGDAGFYERPIYKTAAQLPVETNERTVNSVTTVAYAEFNLYFRCTDDNGTATQVEKDVYLSGLELEAASGAEDVTPAIRIKIDGQNDFVIALDNIATNTYGNLDLNDNGEDDTDDILVDDLEGDKITYYAGTSTSSYTPVLKETAMPGIADPYAFTNKTGKALATTAEGSADSDVVKVQVWLEGWAPLESETIWDKKFIEQDFSLKLQFACEADY